ncbi:TRAP transporter large permease [Rhodoferax bucti]|uniref:TRAP transporter large permease n=1 Tax=Rhodoferax bucti TaxID=2576305 RepID=UPI001108D35C|nr:TRAP transporter large permease subunit [Rhodoferax bucti]
MSPDLLAPLMFATLVIVLLAGFPVAFSLAAVAMTFGALGVALGHFHASFLLVMPLRVQGVFNSDNFLAVPLFVLMGLILERTGVAENTLVALGRLFGSTPGGLLYATIIVGAALSAITGFVSASVIAMGLIALPAMLKAGYDARMATGAIAAAGTLAQMLPPSLVLIVLAEQVEVPLIDIFHATLLPSAILVGLYLLFVLIATKLRPSLAPPIATLEVTSRKRMWLDAGVAAGVPLGLICTILVSVYFGIATPTEGGAIGVCGALLIGAARRRLAGGRLSQALTNTGVLCSSVIFLLLGASFFTLVFRGFDGQVWIEGLFQHLPEGQTPFLLAVILGIFLLGFFLDFFEIAFIAIPLITPVARKLGVDMVWLTVMIAVVLQTSFMHPPFGIALYNLRSIAPATVRTAQIYMGAIPFLAIQLLMVGILVAFPGLATIEQVQVQATEQEIEDALHPASTDTVAEPDTLELEKSR